MAHKPGDTWTHNPTGASFVAQEGPAHGCTGCAGRDSRRACLALPQGCVEHNVVWKPINNQAESFAVILRMQK
jgi:hypothetical protein